MTEKSAPLGDHAAAAERKNHVETTLARRMLKELSREAVGFQFICSNQESFAVFLKESGIQPDAKLYEDFVGLAMSSKKIENDRRQCLQNITVLLDHIAEVSADLKAMVEAAKQRLSARRQFSSAQPDYSHVHCENDPITQMCETLTEDPIFIDQVIFVGHSFMQEIKSLQTKVPTNSSWRLSALNEVERIFGDILLFCHDYSLGRERLQPKIASVRNELEILLGSETMALAPQVTLEGEIIETPTETVEEDPGQQNVVIKTDVEEVEDEVPELKVQTGPRESGVRKNNSSENFYAAIVKTAETHEELRSQDPSPAPNTLEHASSVRDILALSGVGIAALAKAASMPPEVLLDMKERRVVCKPYLLSLLIKHAKDLPRLAPGASDYVAQAPRTQESGKKVKLRFTRGTSERKAEEPAINLDEEILDEGQIQGLLTAYGVTLREIFPCPAGEDAATHETKLQKIENIMKGTRHCKRGRLIALHKTIEDACHRALERRHEGTDLAARGRDKEGPRRTIDREGVLQSLLTSKKTFASVVHLSLPSKMRALTTELGRKATQEQKLAIRELSTMTLETLRDILAGTGECSVATFTMLERVLRNLENPTRNPDSARK